MLVTFNIIYIIMIKINNWFLELSLRWLEDSLVYTDRNWVFNWLKWANSLMFAIRDRINCLNSVLGWNLKVVSNESEDTRKKIVTTDLNNWLRLCSDNYKLSTQSAVKFIKETLWCEKCYFIWNWDVWVDIESMWLKILNISSEVDLWTLEEDVPILFARPPFAINTRFKSDDEIENNIQNDISFRNLTNLIKRSNQKVVFCHTKPNCYRVKNNEEFRELNLWFYFDLLVNKYGYVNWIDIFDLWKWDYWTWAFFDLSLWIKYKWDYSRVIGIWDMSTDIEYTLQNWWTWILVNSWDGVITEEVLSRLRQYSDKFYNILDLSYLKLI